jgi:predicted esterase
MRRAHELADFVGAAAGQYQFDPQNLTAVGYSNGANIAAAVLLLRPGVLTRAILFRAMVPLTPATLPNLAGARVLICSGKHDPIVPVENAERLAAMLREAGADVNLRFEGASHQLVFAEIDAAKSWLRES